MLLKDIQAGDTLIPDSGFTCITAGRIVTVEADDKGELFVPCKDGRHYLSGQAGDNGELVGLYPYQRDGEPLLDPRTTVELMADRDGKDLIITALAFAQNYVDDGRLPDPTNIIARARESAANLYG